MPKSFHKLDPSGVRDSIALLPAQCREAWDAVKNLSLPSSFKHVSRIAIVGMGGSGLGPHLVQSVFRDRIEIPVAILNSYDLPEWVGETTLVILSSYSGTTEEVLEAFRHAKKRGAKIAGTATGGDLERLCRGADVPFLKIIPVSNPAGAPRLALGYSILGIAGILARAGLLELPEREVKDAIDECASAIKRLGPATSWVQNPAKQIGRDLKGRVPIVVAAGHLEGNAHIFQNQLHETAKQFAAHFCLSELNHHLLEGLTHPKTQIKKMSAVFLHSSLYHPRIKKRVEITSEVFRKQGLKVHEWSPPSHSALGQAFESLVFTSYVAFYLAMHNRENPAPNPWVDYFKKKLS